MTTTEITVAAIEAGAQWLSDGYLGIAYDDMDADGEPDETESSELIAAIAKATDCDVTIAKSGGNGAPEGGFWTVLRFDGRTIDRDDATVQS